MSGPVTSTSALRQRTAVVLSEGAGGLGAVRALCKHRVPTIAVAFDRRATVLASRLPMRKVYVEAGSAEQLQEGLLSVLRTVASQRPVLIPTSDRLVSFIHRNATALAKDFALCLPDAGLAARLNDKHDETRLIASLGIPLPKTVQELPDRWQDLQQALGLPLIIKTRSYRQSIPGGRKNVVSTSREQLERFYRECGHMRDAVLAQEVIPGPDDSLWLCSCTFNRRHELVEALVKRKLRMSPPHFGVCSLAVSASNPEFLELVRQLGALLRYTGHASIEFKWDRRDGLYKYIEINPRIPASVALDEASGVPTVWSTYRLALGEDVTPVATRQHDGVVYVKRLEDIANRLRDRERPWVILWHHSTLVFRKRVGAHFAWHDPRPGLAYAWWFAREKWAGLWRRLRLAR
jgi:predicted ATP-grasp superfamily ATP-dependent carboligase